jgi:hypothetical protein
LPLPPLTATVTVNCCEVVILNADGVTLTVGSVVTTCVTTFDVLAAKLMLSGWYVAVIACEPLARKEIGSDAAPAFSCRVAIGFCPSMNCTLPVGVPELEVTVAVSVTDWK